MRIASNMSVLYILTTELIRTAGVVFLSFFVQGIVEQATAPTDGADGSQDDAEKGVER